MQPDPLYQTGICIESGGFAVDLPEGKCHVFVNLDSPSGFWGEYQIYRQRIVRANGREAVKDTMDLPAFQAKYFRFADVEDQPEDNTFRTIHDAGSDWGFYNGGNRWTFGVYMFKCAKQYGMKFRVSWHWNACAGDPYYALDCREDDYAWCVANAKMELIPSIHFERDIRAGIDDYRYMLTLSRRLRERPGHPAATAARKLLDTKLASFKLGERDHNAKWPVEEFRTYRLHLAEAIERLLK